MTSHLRVDRDRWGLSPYLPDDPKARRTVELALAALDAKLDEPRDFDEADVLVGEDLVYLPHRYIGSVGTLFVPSRSQLVTLGSYAPVDDFLWAYHRGVDLVGETRFERQNDLTIHEVRDLEAMILRLHGKRLTGLTRVELRRLLCRLPATFVGVDLYFRIRFLRDLEESGDCVFEVTPGTWRPPEVIRFSSATGEYGCFSNFARHRIVIDGQTWKSSEHYFQAQKLEDPKDREVIRAAKTSMRAATMGRDRSRKLRSDWESVKVSVMREAVAAKFRQHPHLAAELVATGGAELVAHTAKDAFWGDGGDGSGQNVLGRLLMDLRAELAEEKDRRGDD